MNDEAETYNRSKIHHLVAAMPMSAPRNPIPGTQWELIPSAEAVDLKRRGYFADDEQHGSTFAVKFGDCSVSTEQPVKAPLQEEWNSSEHSHNWRSDFKTCPNRRMEAKPEEFGEHRHKSVSKSVTDKTNNNNIHINCNSIIVKSLSTRRTEKAYHRSEYTDKTQCDGITPTTRRTENCPKSRAEREYMVCWASEFSGPSFFPSCFRRGIFLFTEKNRQL